MSAASPALPIRLCNMRPDAPDFRDRLYSPSLRYPARAFNPQPYDDAKQQVLVKDQEQTEACTGFALAAMVEMLTGKAWLANDQQEPMPQPISPYMLYYMACRYDNLPGIGLRSGTTARATIKAWYKNGACHLRLWPTMFADSALANPQWIADAFRTPLGAYYRVDHTAISDVHAALNEVGVVFVTASIHEGWMTPDEDGTIPFTGEVAPLGGHAFLLVGYDEEGFLLQNSWGSAWGRAGFARLTYADWRASAMDAWVGQLGVQTSRHADSLATGLDYARAVTGGAVVGEPARALLASDPNVSAQQINPYVIDLENNGVLSDSGQFHTTAGDLRLLLSQYLPQALAQWGGAEDKPVDVAIYAHGGLDDEAAAEEIAKTWVPALFGNQIFPIFLMWETGLLQTLEDKVADLAHGIPALAGASFYDRALDWWDQRVEALVSAPGTVIWNEMKKNARLASGNPAGGLRLLYQELLKPDYAKLRPRLRLHLIGHSAGAIFQAYLLPDLIAAGLSVEGIYLMAPACRVELFTQNILPAFEGGKVAKYAQFHLTDSVEIKDNCKPLPYYHSLLYLVSNAFEVQHGAPVLGMEKFFVSDPDLTSNRPSPAKVWDAITSPTNPLPADPRFASTSTSHGGFSQDGPTRRAIIERIKS